MDKLVPLSFVAAIGLGIGGYLLWLGIRASESNIRAQRRMNRFVDAFGLPTARTLYVLGGVTALILTLVTVMGWAFKAG
jgi:hypothetical protein